MAVSPGNIASNASTVTFLFTDIEGSTKRWDTMPDAMTAALAHHDVLLRSAIENNGGTSKTVGDAFYAAFPFNAATFSPYGMRIIATTHTLSDVLHRNNWRIPAPASSACPGGRTGERERRSGARARESRPGRRKGERDRRFGCWGVAGGGARVGRGRGHDPGNGGPRDGRASAWTRPFSVSGATTRGTIAL